MSSVTVDELIMRIEIELDKFRSEAAQAESIDKSLRESLQKTGETSKKTGEKSKKLGGDVASTNKEFLKQIRSLVTLTNRLVRFFAVITGSNAMAKLGSGIAQANDHLGFLQKRLGMTARDIRGVDTAVAALGGSGAGAMDTLHKLNQGIQQMVLMGDDSLIPFFSALGIGVIDASGKMRAMDDILLDMADSFSRMDPQQAYALANAMGLDEGVTNALVQGAMPCKT